jgi:hypothetical protein
MPSVRRLIRPLAAAALAAGAAAPLAAQDAGTPAARFTLGGYLANYWFDGGGSDGRASVGGYGVRLMFNRSTPARVARSFFDRASAGAFATLTTEQDGVSTQNIGGEVDVALFPTPIAAGRLDPFIGLGAGILRSDNEDDRVGASTDFALTPSIGTRIPFFSGIGFRGDLRTPIVFRDGDTRAHFLIEGGIYISF